MHCLPWYFTQPSGCLDKKHWLSAFFGDLHCEDLGKHLVNEASPFVSVAGQHCPHLRIE